MSSTSEVGFLKSLFDFQLRHYITLRVLRVLYAIFTIVILIVGVVFFLFAMFSLFPEDPAVGFLAIIVTPLVVVLYLIIIRLYVESLANLQRVGDKTQKMVEQNSSN
jgi:uncharacterized membrane protein